MVLIPARTLGGILLAIAACLATSDSSCHSLVQSSVALGRHVAVLEQHGQTDLFQLAGKCVPDTNQIWLWEVFHKTGTVLSRKMLSDIGQRVENVTHVTTTREAEHKLFLDMDYFDKSLYDASISEKCQGEGMFTFSNTCLELAKTTAVRAIYGTRFLGGVTQGEMKDRFLRISAELGMNVNMISFLRDPLQLVTSAYVYHLISCTEEEKWLFESPSELVTGFFEHCDADDGDGKAVDAIEPSTPSGKSRERSIKTPPPASEACSAARRAIPLRLRNKTSYRDLLTNLTMQQGILVESWRSYEDIQDMSDRYVLYQSLPDGTGTTVLMDDLMGNCTKGFQKIWRALGVKKADQDRCVQLGCEWIDEGKTDPHATSSEHSLKAEVRDALSSNNWFAKHVQPLRVQMGIFDSL